MAREIKRRDFLAGAGAAGIVTAAGCIGSPDGGGGGGSGNGSGNNGSGGGGGGGNGSGGGGGGGGESGGGPGLLVVIGYPESGIQLFRDYYSRSTTDENILVPDGLRDGALPNQVGNDMNNVTGTAPAAGGPNQQAFTQMFQSEYGGPPGVFTSQSYDSVATLILANVAAGENSGSAIQSQMRNIANPPGMAVGPSNFVEGVEAVANGEDVDYQGASSSVNFDENGDPASAAYAIWEFARQQNDTSTVTTQTFEGDSPEGSGPSADSIPGSSMDRTVQVGILLPETGDLASVGGPMIQAAQLPVKEVNDSDLGLSVDAQVQDTQTQPEAGISGAEALVNAGVPAVCGTASSGVNVPVSQQVLIPNQVVGCSPSSTALNVTNLEDDDFIFRTAPSDFLQGRVMAQVGSDRLSTSNAATLFVNNEYGQQLSNRFAEVFENEFDGSVSQQVAFNIGESSYTSVIEQALSS
jgi:ABC-type branched-subunit amino acid transport system substrate-binding protein